MKKLTIVALLILGTFASLSAQTYQQDATGKIIKVEAPRSATAKDSTLVQELDGIKFWQGTNGGIFYWTESKKTGKMYKRYVKRENKPNLVY